MTQTVDADTANRLREEFGKVSDAVRGKGQTTLEDPLGEDGVISVLLESFRESGAGEMHLLKDDGQGSKRWTKYRSWGPQGTDYIEKASYLLQADGSTEFHKKRLEPGDQVVASDSADEADDQAWVATLS